jgi:mono/diheme cytochrome c family protein
MTFKVRFSIGTIAAAFLLTLAVATPVTTQTSPASPQTTLDGVYSPAQATRGDGTFSSLCTGCHTASSFEGGSFRVWADTPLSELYAYLVETMPEDAPGSLTPAQYADIVAFLLKTNDMPAGKEDLKPDTAALARITIKFRGR